MSIRSRAVISVSTVVSSGIFYLIWGTVIVDFFVLSSSPVSSCSYILMLWYQIYSRFYLSGERTLLLERCFWWAWNSRFTIYFLCWCVEAVIPFCIVSDEGPVIICHVPPFLFILGFQQRDHDVSGCDVLGCCGCGCLSCLLFPDIACYCFKIHSGKMLAIISSNPFPDSLGLSSGIWWRIS